MVSAQSSAMRLNPITTAIALWMSIFAACFLMFAGCGGCAAGKGQLNPTTGVYDTSAAADMAVVSAQNIREVALGVFDSFMRVEKQNDAALRTISPKIHEIAELVRRDGK